MANVEALQQLRRVVLEAPDEQFDMTFWEQKNICGTTRCAAGWAAIDPWHRQNTNINALLPVVEKEGKAQLIHGWMTGADDFGMIYDILPLDSLALFGNFGHIPKDYVIENIDRLIRGERAIPYDERDKGADL